MHNTNATASGRNDLKALVRVRGLLPAAAAIAAALSAGCANIEPTVRARDVSSMQVGVGDQRNSAIPSSVARVTSTGMVDSDEVARPYLAGAPVPLAQEVTLPLALRQGVNTTILFRSPQRDLMSLAEGITRATNIPVRVKPDALLPMANFLPRAGGAATTSPAGGSGLESTSIDIRSEDAPLNEILDRVASRLAVSWRFDGRVIEIYRLESRTYSVKSLPVKVSTTAGMGRNASQGGAFDNASGTKYVGAESDPFTALKASIEARMTRAGIGPILSPETGTIVVTDTPESLKSIQHYLDRENRLLSRKVELLFEVVQIRVADNGQLGFDWSVLATRLEDAVTTTLALTTPGSLVTSLAGGARVTEKGGRFDGSKAMLSALAEIGTVVSTTRVPLTTINRRPASTAVRTTFNYIDQASGQATAGATSSTVSAPTVTQKDETVGTILTVIPDVDDEGRVQMSVSYDNTTLTKLEPFTSGSGNASVTVQQKQIDGTGVLQQITTRVGIPTVIGGFERTTTEATERRLGANVPLLLGGSNRAVNERNVTVLMVTAIARDDI